MLNYIFILIYIVFAVIWIILLKRGEKKFGDMVEPLDGNNYMLKSLYVVGFEILDIVKYSYDTVLDRKRLPQAKIVYGEKYGEYYYRVNVAEKVTYISFFVMLAPALGPIFGEPVFSVFGLALAGIGYYYADSKITDIISDRELSISKDFSDMVSKMALLINAGMITREAWEEIAVTGEGVVYDEMKTSIIDMQNGMSEIDAYIGFGNRCGVQFVKKFISMLVQNLSKGNKELVDFLKAETAASWEEKKHAVKQQGEKAANKLMIPLGMILVGIFVMILVPIVSNLGL